jgi:hypothetical protein
LNVIATDEDVLAGVFAVDGFQLNSAATSARWKEHEGAARDHIFAIRSSTISRATADQKCPVSSTRQGQGFRRQQRDGPCLVTADEIDPTA